MKIIVRLTAANLLALGLIVSLASVADAQPNNDEAGCIKTLNKAFEKVVKTQGKDIVKCIKDFAKGKTLANPTLEACTTADIKGSVLKATAKTHADFGKKCSDLPPFGPVDADVINSVGVNNHMLLAHSIFGPDLDLTIRKEDPDKAASRCQQTIFKAALKCADTKLKTFNKCKKDGINRKTPPGAIVDQAALEALCFPGGTEINQLGKDAIDKACGTSTVTGVGKAMHAKCSGAGLDQAAIDALFPSVLAGATAAELERIVECQVCRALTEVDNLSLDCDAFDDGTVNGTCGGAVPFCGNGIVEAPESCDGVDLGGQTCQGLGFLSGTLACSGDCQFDTSTCASPGGQGDACTSGTDCEQGLLCVDGVCCTSACTGTCESCALPGSQGTCSLVAAGQDPDAECAGFACTGFYWGFSGDTCHQREDISAAACSGTGICQTAAELCPLQGQGPATLTCDATCQDPAAGSCTGTTAGACDDINPGSTTCGQGICGMTAPVCINGIPNACTPGNPQAEMCNNLDDDCDGVVDDGLAGDALEPDNSCSSIRTLATVGSGQTRNRTDLTIYPSGDNDYFEIPAVETDSTCECCDFFCFDEDYQLKVTLTVPPGAGSYRFCTGTSCSGVDATCQTVAAGQFATWIWTLDGACAVSDSYSRFVRISGLGSPGFECLPYTLSYSFTPGCF